MCTCPFHVFSVWDLEFFRERSHHNIQFHISLNCAVCILNSFVHTGVWLLPSHDCSLTRAPELKDKSKGCVGETSAMNSRWRFKQYLVWLKIWNRGSPASLRPFLPLSIHQPLQACACFSSFHTSLTLHIHFSLVLPFCYPPPIRPTSNPLTWEFNLYCMFHFYSDLDLFHVGCF